MLFLLPIIHKYANLGANLQNVIQAYYHSQTVLFA